MPKRRRSSDIICCNSDCPLHGEITGELEELITSGKIFDWRDNSGNDAFVHSAAGHSFCGPCIHTFNFLYYQEIRPYSAEQRAGALELLGSTCILMGKYEDGFNYWLNASKLRSNPRKCFDEANIPPLTRRHATPQWTSCNDVVRMRQRIDSDQGVLNALCQAQVVQLAHGVSLNVAKRLFPSSFSVPSHRDEMAARSRLALLLFEWDEFHGWHSLSLDQQNVQREIVHITTCLIEQFKFSSRTVYGDVRQRFILNATVFLKWLATAMESHRGGYIQYLDGVMMCILSVLMALCNRSAMNNQLEQCLKRIVAVNWRMTNGQTLLLMASSCSRDGLSKLYASNYPADKDLAPTLKKVIRLLVVLGANVNNVDHSGNSCLHLIIQCDWKANDPANIKFLLDSGAYAHVKNNLGMTPASMLRGKLSKLRAIVVPSFPTLQCLCSRVLRINGVNKI